MKSESSTDKPEKDWKRGEKSRQEKERNQPGTHWFLSLNIAGEKEAGQVQRLIESRSIDSWVACSGTVWPKRRIRYWLFSRAPVVTVLSK